MGTVVKADILVLAYLDTQGLVLAVFQVQAAFQGFLEFLAILEFQVTLEHLVIQAHLDTRASADIQVHQAIPASAGTQVRLAFLVIQELADIRESVATVAFQASQVYRDTVDIPAL